MRAGMEVVLVSNGAGHPYGLGSGDLPSLAELIRQTPGAHPIGSVDELRCDVFDDDQEFDDFLAFVAASRRTDLAPRRRSGSADGSDPRQGQSRQKTTGADRSAAKP
jgi:hypothetical protein